MELSASAAPAQEVTPRAVTGAFDVVVIGAGIAGLTSAALLQRSGARVLLLEAHDTVGGCAGYFDIHDTRAGRFRFDAGATVALGLEAGGLHRRVFQHLQTECPAHRMDGLRVLLPRREIFWAHDAPRWKRERRSLPGNRVAQELFWRIQETVADAGWLALHKLPSLPLQTSRDWCRMLRCIDVRLAPLAPFLNCTVGTVLQFLGLSGDREFMQLVNLALMITVQNEAATAPMTGGCAGLDLWRHGGWHCAGGMGALARTLAAAFVRDGGMLQLGARVEQIEKQRGGFLIRHAGSAANGTAGESTAGETFVPRVVANLPLDNLTHLMDLPPRAAKNVAELQERGGEGWGAVTLYAALRDTGTGPLHHQVLLDDAARPADGRDVFLSLSQPNDELQAPRGWRTLTASTHTRLSDWRGLSPQEYRAQKKVWREKLLAGVRRALPNIDEARSFALCGTPHTWEHYTQRAEGFVGGVPQSLSTANLNAFPQRLGVRNLWLVGDSTFPGQGTVSCTLSGINTWRDITGKTL